MLARERQLVDRFSSELKGDVIPNDALPYLQCLTEDDRELVQNKQDREGPRAAVPILLDRLKRRPDSFEQLLTALEYSGCKHLKNLLVNSMTGLPQFQGTQSSMPTPTEETSCPLKSGLLSSPSQETDYFEFDIFVCYSPKDRDVAFKMRKIMKKDFNLLVCIDEVDFIPGNAISDNICDCIRRSKAIVFLLTPHFLEKKWGVWEMQHALLDFLEYKGSPKSKKIVPVLVKECEVPDELRPYSPINFQESCETSESESWKRLAAAVVGKQVGGSTFKEKSTRTPKLAMPS